MIIQESKTMDEYIKLQMEREYYTKEKQRHEEELRALKNKMRGLEFYELEQKKASQYVLEHAIEYYDILQRYTSEDIEKVSGLNLQLFANNKYDCDDRIMGQVQEYSKDNMWLKLLERHYQKMLDKAAIETT